MGASPATWPIRLKSEGDSLEQQGRVHVYTGDGKGKTTAALGLALRVLGHGYKVFMVQFMKGRTYGELVSSERISGMTIIMSGRDAFFKKGEESDADRSLALGGLELARDAINSGEYRLVILDEINVALDFALLDLDDVLPLLAARPSQVEIVCTGRNAPAELIQAADLVTEMREVKHYFHAGVPMRKGIEF